jgi:hypothetical protein
MILVVDKRKQFRVILPRYAGTTMLVHRKRFNMSGQLGIRNQKTFMHPTLNKNLEKFPETFPGSYHALGLDKEGSLWSWERGSKIRLGKGNSNNSRSPQKISFPSRVVAAACGLYHSIALTEVSEGEGKKEWKERERVRGRRKCKRTMVERKESRQMP